MVHEAVRGDARRGAGRFRDGKKAGERGKGARPEGPRAVASGGGPGGGRGGYMKA